MNDSDNWYLMDGYLAKTVNGKSKYQHVIVAEEVIGRKLKRGECVHHKDENKVNNDPGNLIVFASKADHVSFHRRELDDGCLIPVGDGTFMCSPKPLPLLKCSQCQKPFRAVRKKGRNVFCSQACASASQQRVIRPSTDELIAQIEKSSYEQVARDLSVSSNAIRKWLRRDGINPKTLSPFSQGQGFKSLLAHRSELNTLTEAATLSRGGSNLRQG